MAIGRDVLDRLDDQDYDTSDPLQSDTDLDEKKEVKNYLEASFDRGILSGLPKKVVWRYRKLIFKEYFRVFGL